VPELKTLCDNPKIIAGGNYLTFIFVFRGGKYWQFDNKPKLKKPLGNLIEGGSMAKNRWPGIHFPGAIGNNGDNFIIVYKEKWIQWLPNGEIDVEEGSIGEKVIEIPDEPEGNEIDSGALIPIDGKEKYGKVHQNKVCFVIIKNNKCFWSGECLTFTEDPNRFPPNIIAYIRAGYKNRYFFDNNGKYCKRPIYSNTEVKVSYC
jgi:hypothetical protein